MDDDAHPRKMVQKRLIAHAQRAVKDVDADPQREQRNRAVKAISASLRAIRIAPFVMTSY